MAASTCCPPLERSNERPQFLAQYPAPLHGLLDVPAIEQSDPFGKQQMSFQFLQRALCNPKILNERLSAFASVAFRNIRRNSRGRAPDLRRHREHFFAWQFLCEPIAKHSQFHPVLPNLQVPVGIDRWFAQRASLFATHHSPFATRYFLPRTPQTPPRRSASWSCSRNRNTPAFRRRISGS